MRERFKPLVDRFYVGKATLADGTEFDMTMAYTEDGNHVRAATDLEVQLLAALSSSEIERQAMSAMLNKAARTLSDAYYTSPGTAARMTEAIDAVVVVAKAMTDG